MDTIEANMHTVQVTAHSCSTPPGEYIDACDTAGARRNSWSSDPLGLCAADNCVIDSRKPFRHVQSFITDNNDTLIRVENRLLQGTHVFAFNGTYGTYERSIEGGDGAHIPAMALHGCLCRGSISCRDALVRVQRAPRSFMAIFRSHKTEMNYIS